MKKSQLLVIVAISIPVIIFGVLYYQMSSIEISLTASEQQIVSWIGSVLLGQMPEFKIILHFHNPTFTAVDISDLIINVYIEDEFQFDTSLDHMYLPAGKSMVKEVTVSLSNIVGLSSKIIQAVTNYAGEVKVSISGSANAHLMFLSTRLSFSSTDYYYLAEGQLTFSEAYWIDSAGNEISRTEVGERVGVVVRVYNPRRAGTISSMIEVRIRLDVDFWFDEDMGTYTDSIIVQPSKFDTVSFSFSPQERAWFHFDVYLDNNHVYVQPNSSPPRLSVQ